MLVVGSWTDVVEATALSVFGDKKAPPSPPEKRVLLGMDYSEALSSSGFVVILT